MSKGITSAQNNIIKWKGKWQANRRYLQPDIITNKGYISRISSKFLLADKENSNYLVEKRATY